MPLLKYLSRRELLCRNDLEERAELRYILHNHYKIYHLFFGYLPFYIDNSWLRIKVFEHFIINSMAVRSILLLVQQIYLEELSSLMASWLLDDEDCILLSDKWCVWKWLSSTLSRVSLGGEISHKQRTCLTVKV